MKKFQRPNKKHMGPTKTNKDQRDQKGPTGDREVPTPGLKLNSIVANIFSAFWKLVLKKGAYSNALNARSLGILKTFEIQIVESSGLKQKIHAILLLDPRLIRKRVNIVELDNQWF